MNTRTKLELSTLATLALSGCGGGSNPLLSTAPTGGVPRATAVPTAPFTPNYIPSLETGFHWTKDTLKVFVDAPQTDARVASVKEGVALWTSFPGSPFRAEYVASAEGADVTVKFVPQSALPGDFAGNTTTYHLEPSMELAEAQVELRDDVKNANLVTLTAHEFGHALGIHGHSAEASDAMFPVAPNPGRVTQPDANTIAEIYEEGRARSASLTRASQRLVKFSIE